MMGATVPRLTLASAAIPRAGVARCETRQLKGFRSSLFAGAPTRVASTWTPRTPANSRRSAAATVVPTSASLWRIAAMPAMPTLPAREAMLLQSVLGSMCVGAVLLVVTSLFTATGRKKWSDFFSNIDNLLPQNAALKRSFQWLPVIVVAKGLESAFGLPLLNWVYVAYSASMVQTMIGQAKEMSGPAREQILAGVREAEARKAARAAGGDPAAYAEAGPSATPSEPGADVNPFMGGFSTNTMAANLFLRRFPELAGETYCTTCPVMWREGGKDQGGQLYVTDRSLAFHGTFGRGTQVLKLDQERSAAAWAGSPLGAELLLSLSAVTAKVGAVTEATVAGEKYSAFTLAVGDRGEVTVTGVNALGGNTLYPIVSKVWGDLVGAR